jgi:SAM-dependent methyltransferase
VAAAERDHPVTPKHLGGHYDGSIVDLAALEYLRGKFRITSMVDVGCGLGAMVREARERGIDAVGVEGDPAVFDPTVMLLHDFTSGPILLGRRDLVWCVEFVEHVEGQYENNFLSTFQCADLVFMTHALPGQGGYHHVNEQPSDYWITRLRHMGFALDEASTEWLRHHGDSYYTKQTGLLFRRIGSTQFTPRGQTRREPPTTIPGWFHAASVYENAVRTASDGAHFVEVGAYLGKGSAFLACETANAGKRIIIDVVDPWDNEYLDRYNITGSPGRFYEKFLGHMRAAGVLELIRPIRLGSLEAAAQYAPGSLDFVFIDGDHDYAAVRADIVAWLPLVKDGGVLAGDDFLDQWPGVQRAVRELLGGRVEFYGPCWVYRKNATRSAERA